MKATSVSIKLTHAQRKQSALVSLGINPASLAMRKSTQVQRDRKKSAKAGYEKHRSRAFD